MISRAAARLARRRRIRNRALTWSIRISAPGDPSGDVWGDVAFAADLAAALERRGQRAEVVRRGASARPADVVLVLRGLYRIDAEPGALSYLWIISHPELVDADEAAAGWRRVLAASLTWTAPGGVPTEPLLQATAAERFHPGAPRNGFEHDVLFVGTSRRIHRPVVMDAAALDIDLAVYGHDWEPYLDARRIRAQRLDSRDLPDAYRGARRVLNDHWDDMRRDGFLSNRLFDAVACGARVVSDDVPGLASTFGPAVRTYRSADELQALLADDEGWPSDAEMRVIAERILDGNSFDARAGQLVESALADFAALSRPVSRVLLDRLRSR